MLVIVRLGYVSLSQVRLGVCVIVMLEINRKKKKKLALGLHLDIYKFRLSQILDPIQKFLM